MPITLRIPGLPEVSRTAVRGGPSQGATQPVTNLLDDVEVLHAFSLSPAARARGAADPTEVTVPDDAIVEIEVDGFQMWTSAKKYEDTVRAVRPEAAQGDAVFVDALPAPTGATRGEGDRSASAVRVLNLRSRLEDQLQDPAILKEFAEDFGLKIVDRAGSWLLAKGLIWLIERQLKPREGLYHWDQAVRAASPDAPDPAEASFESVNPADPILLFLHGTGSSTRAASASSSHMAQRTSGRSSPPSSATASTRSSTRRSAGARSRTRSRWPSGCRRMRTCTWSRTRAAG